MSKDKLEGLVKRMEATLSEMEQLKLHCSRQSEELSQLVVELRRENQELAQKYEQLAMDMKEAKEIIEQLQDTKFAFDAKERQAQKLSRQLWGTGKKDWVGDVGGETEVRREYPNEHIRPSLSPDMRESGCFFKCMKEAWGER